MKHVHYDQVEAEPVSEAGAHGVRIRWLIGSKDAPPNFYMRRFEISPGGSTPRHSHAWEHEVYILEGEGSVLNKGREDAFHAGDVIYVPPDEEHAFRAGKVSVALLCLVPKT